MPEWINNFFGGKKGKSSGSDQESDELQQQDEKWFKTHNQDVILARLVKENPSLNPKALERAVGEVVAYLSQEKGIDITKAVSRDVLERATSEAMELAYQNLKAQAERHGDRAAEIANRKKNPDTPYVSASDRVFQSIGASAERALQEAKERGWSLEEQKKIISMVFHTLRDAGKVSSYDSSQAGNYMQIYIDSGAHKASPALKKSRLQTYIEANY